MQKLSYISNRLFTGLVLVGSLFFISCSKNEQETINSLNELSHYYHYRSLEKTKQYADSVLQNNNISGTQRSEALNNLAFYHIAKMHYALADSLLNEAYGTTDNNIELLITCTQQMRICQRMSRNKEFYEYRQKALGHLERLHEEYEDKASHTLSTPPYQRLSRHSKQRMQYAESEMRLVTSVYDYYVGKTDAAIAALHEVDSLPFLKQDTVQYVAYLYDIGSGGILTHGTNEDIMHQELEYLMQCYVISLESGYIYWQANALQSLSEHLSGTDASFQNDQLAQRYLNLENIPDSMVAGYLAQQSLDLFTKYGDTYQTAAAWRTLATCYWDIKDYPGAVYSLQHAVADTLIKQSPSLLSSINEQFSLAFSALGEKHESDYNRNEYLDLYEGTRQDRQNEARAEILERSAKQLNITLAAIILLIVIFAVLLTVQMVKRYRSRKAGDSKHSSSVQRWLDEKGKQLEALKEEQEETEEQCAMTQLTLSKLQDEYVEHRAQVHLINSLTPIIERMAHEVECLDNKHESDDIVNGRRTYVTELVDHINNVNDFLTQWIKLRRGELSLKIESFSLNSLFNIILQSQTAFNRKGVNLVIEKTDATIKADKTLTLFMLNTLNDNARKFTPAGGTVTISAQEVNEMVEVSVTDTGAGMTEEQCQHIFDVKPIVDEELGNTNQRNPKSHGFGLLNCKGIIEKYKKTNSLFSQSTIGVDSKVGKGTRFYFRLPKGIRKALLVTALVISNIVLSMPATAQTLAPDTLKPETTEYKQVIALYDSLYSCNVTGHYEQAINYALQCLHVMNLMHNKEHQYNECSKTDTLVLCDQFTSSAPELRWFKDSVDIPFKVLMSIRNEVAIAALALNEWDIYHYNNKVYSLLFKEYFSDNNLANYCEQMEEQESNRNIAIMLLVLLLIACIPLYYFLYYRHVINDTQKAMKHMQEQINQQQSKVAEARNKLEMLTFETSRLHITNNVVSNSLSSIKHETMYYPSRIKQMITTDAPTHDITELINYYRSIYGMLSEHTEYNCRQQLPVDVLSHMLLRLLAQLSAQRIADIEPSEQNDRYTIYTIPLARPNEVKQRQCTQIVRDLGEIYNERRCGITEQDGHLIVTIPRR